jgi:putative hydrolase of HD superfamily
MTDTRLESQIHFIIEIDKLKNILRRTKLMDGSRNENDAEHSWHLAIMAVLLSEYAKENIDILKVIKMVVIHDIVEIDAGDTFVYERPQGLASEKELQAAKRIFNLLPDDQAIEIMELWKEFEARQTSESRFAAALDRLQPILCNCQNKGGAWQEHGITYDQVIERNKHIADGAPELWKYAEKIIKDAVSKGFLSKRERK